MLDKQALFVYTALEPREKATMQYTDEMKKAKVAEFDLNQHTWRVMQNEPFYTALLRRLDRRVDESCPTFGVALDAQRGQFYVVYNPTFAAGLDDAGLGAVIVHELLHIVFEHVTSRQPAWKCGIAYRSDEKCRGCEHMSACNRMHKQHNYAADLAINSFLADKLPTACWDKPLNLLIPGQGAYMHAPVGQSMEFYLDWLKTNDVDIKLDSIDDHSQWISDDSGDMSDSAAVASAKAAFKQAMGEAVSEVVKQGRGWGTVSSDMQKDILDRLSSRLDWKSMLRYFVARSRRADKRSTMMRVNRRYPYMHAGSKRNYHANIAICVDMSGSVSDALLGAFFGELDGMAAIAQFTMVPFDTRVDESDVFVWKRGQRGLGSRTHCGGTDFQAVSHWVVKHGKFDGMIVMTDLEAPKPAPLPNGIKRLWITDETHGKTPYFDTTPEPMVWIPKSDMK